MKGRRAISLFASLQLLVLCGCMNARYMRYDYKNYSDAYGKTFNQQLLLNLARESQQDPVYFLQLGSISSQYQFSTSGGLAQGGSRTAPVLSRGIVQRVLTFGGSVNAAETQTPVFQFLPITGSNYVHALIELLPDKIFWAYYDQGWEADWLVRMMVDSIRVTTNLHSPEAVYFNDPQDPTYSKFLEFCSDLRDAQFFQTLIVDKNTNEEKTVFEGKNVQLKDVVAAVQAGLSVTNSSGVTTAKVKSELKFKLKYNDNFQTNEYKNCYACDPTTLSSSRALAKQVNINFTFRTFETVMNAMANEQDLFTNIYNTSYIKFTNDDYGPVAIVTRSLPYDPRSESHMTFTDRP